MNFPALRQAVCEANLALVRHGLILFTWGNASACDRAEGVMAIKPSGVPYPDLTPEKIVLIDLATGQPREPDALRPSSDTPTHLELYRGCSTIGGIVHTHSKHATAWSQAGRDLPCFGTTHADYFYGTVPCTEHLSPQEIANGYERQTGLLILREFRQRGLDPQDMPAVLVRGHAPFVWGIDVDTAVHNAVVLEQVAEMGLMTLALSPAAAALPAAMLNKHFQRKHGPGAYYGQK